MSVKQRSNGNWEVRYRDPEGVHRSKTFRLKRDAIIFEKTKRVQIYKGEYTEPINKKITTSELFILYMDSKQNFKPKTRDDVESIWNHIIAPKFAKVPISHINTESINNWISTFVYGTYPITSAYRMNRAIGYLARMLDYSIDLGYLNRNPAYRANGKLIKAQTSKNPEKRPPKALTWDQLRRLAKNCNDFEEMVLLMGLCGLRWAEVVGLRVGDFSDGFEKLNIHRTISEVRGKFFITSTKTDLHRTIYLPKSLALRLQQKLGGKQVADLAFHNEKGNPLHNANFKKRVFLPAIAAAEIPRITIHDLRHTAASIAINRGAEITSVSRMLGHSDTNITLRVYSHHFEEDLMKLSEFIEQQINKDMVM